MRKRDKQQRWLNCRYEVREGSKSESRVDVSISAGEVRIAQGSNRTLLLLDLAEKISTVIDLAEGTYGLVPSRSTRKRTFSSKAIAQRSFEFASRRCSYRIEGSDVRPEFEAGALETLSALVPGLTPEQRRRVGLPVTITLRSAGPKLAEPPAAALRLIDVQESDEPAVESPALARLRELHPAPIRKKPEARPAKGKPKEREQLRALLHGLRDAARPSQRKAVSGGSVDFGAVLPKSTFEQIADIVNTFSRALGTYSGDGDGGRANLHVVFGWWKDVADAFTLADRESDWLIKAIKKIFFAVSFTAGNQADLFNANEVKIVDYLNRVVAFVNDNAEALKRSVDRGWPIEIPYAVSQIETSVADVRAHLTSVITLLIAQDLDSDLAYWPYLLLTGTVQVGRLALGDTNLDQLQTLVPPFDGLISEERLAQLEEAAFARIATLTFDTGWPQYNFEDDFITGELHDFDTEVTIDGTPICEFQLANGYLILKLKIKKIAVHFYWSSAMSDTVEAGAVNLITGGVSNVAVDNTGYGRSWINNAVFAFRFSSVNETDGVSLRTEFDPDASSLNVGYYLQSFSPSLTAQLAAWIAGLVFSAMDAFIEGLAGKAADGLNKAIRGLTFWPKIWHARSAPDGVGTTASLMTVGTLLRGRLAGSDETGAGLVNTNLAPHLTYAVSQRYLSAWLQRCIGTLPDEYLADRSLWPAEVGTRLPADSALKDLPLSAECKEADEATVQNATDRFISVMAGGDWVSRSDPRTVAYADFTMPASKPTEYSLVTRITPTAPIVQFPNQGLSDSAGEVLLSLSIVVEATRLKYTQTFLGISPGRCRMVDASAFEGRPIEGRGTAIAASRLRGFRSLIFGQGPGGDFIDELPPPAGMPNLGPLAAFDRGPAYIEWCTAPKAMWKEEAQKCVLARFLDAKAEVRVSLAVGCQPVQMNWLPPIGLARAWPAFDTRVSPSVRVTITSANASPPLDTLTSAQLTAAVQSFVTAFLTHIGLFDGTSLSPLDRGMQVPPFLYLFEICHPDAPVTQLTNLIDFSEWLEEGHHYRVEGNLLYWRMTLTHRIASLFS